MIILQLESIAHAKMWFVQRMVNIYLKQFEKLGLVKSRSEVSEESPYFRRYYKSVPFELVVSLEMIQNMKEE